MKHGEIHCKFFSFDVYQGQDIFKRLFWSPERENNKKNTEDYTSIYFSLLILPKVKMNSRCHGPSGQNGQFLHAFIGN